MTTITDSIRRLTRWANSIAPFTVVLILVLSITLIVHPRIGLHRLQSEQNIHNFLVKSAAEKRINQRQWWELREKNTLGQFILPKQLVEYLEIQTVKLGPTCTQQLFQQFESSTISTKDYLVFENSQANVKTLLQSFIPAERSLKNYIDTENLLIESTSDPRTLVVWSKHSYEELMQTNGIYNFSGDTQKILVPAVWVSKNVIRFSSKEQMQKTITQLEATK